MTYSLLSDWLIGHGLRDNKKSILLSRYKDHATGMTNRGSEGKADENINSDEGGIGKLGAASKRKSGAFGWCPPQRMEAKAKSGPSLA